ncbi:MAG: diaminopimelate epimerase [Candidatus Melainabacteria bacterium]|nr:diaminopimelate epimerase [Candidatus Melainabacteria bacterium]
MTIFVLPFEKMHGLGNDFIILERRHLPNEVNESELAKHLCNRNFSIGADGIIIVDFLGRDIRPDVSTADFAWNYYNSDGSEAEMCGNGMRCFAKYVFERGFTDENTFSVLTKAGIIKPVIEEDGTVTVNMGKPTLPSKTKEELELDGKVITYTYIEIGNPHCVIFLDKKIGDEKFFKLGPQIEHNKNFPKGVNVEFAHVLKRNEIDCRIWERGCGPTLACGTGACATLVAANINDLADNSAKIYLPGGVLRVNWDKDLNCVYLNGPCTFVYSGQLNLDPKKVCRQATTKSKE